MKKPASVIGNLLATDLAFWRGLDVLHFVVASLIDVWMWCRWAARRYSAAKSLLLDHHDS